MLLKFIADRNRIVDALKFCDIPTIQFNRMPYQAVTLRYRNLGLRTGKNGTSRQFVSTDIAWTVFLIVNAHNVDDRF